MLDPNVYLRLVRNQWGPPVLSAESIGGMRMFPDLNINQLRKELIAQRSRRESGDLRKGSQTDKCIFDPRQYGDCISVSSGHDSRLEEIFLGQDSAAVKLAERRIGTPFCGRGWMSWGQSIVKASIPIQMNAKERNDTVSVCVNLVIRGNPRTDLPVHVAAGVTIYVYRKLREVTGLAKLVDTMRRLEMNPRDLSEWEIFEGVCNTLAKLCPRWDYRIRQLQMPVTASALGRVCIDIGLSPAETKDILKIWKERWFNVNAIVQQGIVQWSFQADVDLSHRHEPCWRMGKLHRSLPHMGRDIFRAWRRQNSTIPAPDWHLLNQLAMKIYNCAWQSGQKESVETLRKRLKAAYALAEVCYKSDPTLPTLPWDA